MNFHLNFNQNLKKMIGFWNESNFKSFGEFNGRKEIYRNFVINPIEIDLLGGFPMDTIGISI